MKILFSKEEKIMGIKFKRLAFTIAKHGRPFGDMWENGWRVSAYKLMFPYFGILKYKL